MAEVEKSWSDEQLQSEDVSKKDIIKFLHENASFEVWKTYLMGFTGAFWGGLTEFIQRGVFFLQTMGNFVLQTKTFYYHFEDFMPVLIAVYLFLIMQLTHWHIYFKCYSTTNADFVAC